ncbi:MAG TPA: hypothetical protein PL048_13540 [Leptospiraceae bacterium]|nr:hypothetical protein [Leptospiraceae bacterium]HMY66441.1 hypothetical protein [Leptospiraceae bacterium]HMZ59797.1 hypothetical protein [Leptospiraceae bacterium]HNF13708.1 hypothetical protein [Leptospiraceae bacterium]HNF25871.1 hypothetical protein [Leptospiraceae bacterium]
MGDSLHDLNAAIDFLGIITGLCAEEDWMQHKAQSVSSLADLL